MEQFSVKKLFTCSLFMAVSFFTSLITLAEESTEYQFDRLWPQLEQPWYFESSSELAVASDESVYIVDGSHPYVRHFSANGELLKTWEDTSSIAGWYHNIVIAPDDSIYISDNFNNKYYFNKHSIQHFTPKGELLRSWGSHGGKDGQFESSVGGMAIAKDGSIYATDSSNHRIQQFTVEGEFIRKWGRKVKWTWNNGRSSRSSGEGEFSLYGLGSIAIAPDNSIYASDCSMKTQQFSAEGKFIRRWDPGYGVKSIDNFNGLRLLAITEKGDFYYNECIGEAVLNAYVDYSVHQFNSDGEFVRTWEDDMGLQPRKVSPAPDGKVYLYGTGSVQKFSEDGKFIKAWKSRGTRGGYFYEPEDIAVAADGSVYVADIGNSRIQRFDEDGKFIQMWTIDSYHFNKLVVAPDSSVYVLKEDDIQRFTNEGILLQSWDESRAIKFVGNTPYIQKIANENKQLQLFTLDEKLAYSLSEDEAGSENNCSKHEKFYWANDIALGIDGSMYVAGAGHNCIHQFDDKGAFIRAWTIFEKEGKEEARPDDISIAHDGSLYVWCSGYLINHYSAEGKFISSWKLEKGVEEGQFRDPRGMAIAPDGSLYIVDTGNNRIQKFVLK